MSGVVFVFVFKYTYTTFLLIRTFRINNAISNIDMLPVKNQQHTAGNIKLATSSWQHTIGNILLATCCWQHALSNMHLAKCTQQYATSNMHLVICYQQHALSNMLLATCYWQHANFYFHKSTNFANLFGVAWQHQHTCYCSLATCKLTKRK